MFRCNRCRTFKRRLGFYAFQIRALLARKIRIYQIVPRWISSPMVVGLTVGHSICPERGKRRTRQSDFTHAAGAQTLNIPERMRFAQMFRR